MSRILTVIGLVALVVVGVWIGRALWPRETVVVKPPRIITVWDTVQVIDTLWRERVREVERRDTINLIERVVVTVPETVTVFQKFAGVDGLLVGKDAGDETIISGFQQEPLLAGAELRRWNASYFTTGPLMGFVLDSIPPRLVFYPPPPPPQKGCGFFCSLQKYAIGGAVGYLGCRVEQAVVN